MIDLYTKIALTVIAIALGGLCVQGFVRGASAQIECGSTIPCKISIVSGLIDKDGYIKIKIAK